METPTVRTPDESLPYPTSDGRPMAETDVHRKLMTDLIETLDDFYAADPMVYVSGNLLVFYARGDRHRHLSPDVFVVRGVEKKDRDHFLIWEEAHGPELVIELTSTSTREEDVDDKFAMYRDTLRVREYFLFDPLGDYLEPPLQGFRLHEGQYDPIPAVEGRLPSEILGLHLGQEDTDLRLFDPTTGERLPTRRERLEEEQTARRRAEEDRRMAEHENDRLRQELAELRRRLQGTEGPAPGSA